MKKLVLTLILLCANTFSTFAAESGQATIKLELGSRLLFESKALNEEREVLLHLPASYQSSERKYPVLYLLDGERHFQHAILASQLLQQEQRIPELIIVAIPNKPGNRGRDLAREKHKFIQFLQTELMPQINQSYRTSGLNSLYGHSLAGFFTLDLLAQQPELFDNYIAASPPLQGDEKRLYQQYIVNGKKDKAKEKSAYFSLAPQLHEGKAATDAMQSLLQHLQQVSPQNLDWHYDYLQNETHISAYYPSLFNGLSFVFKDYQMPLLHNYQDYQKLGGIKGLKQHYQKRAATYGIDDALPEIHLARIGNFLLQEGHAEDSLQLYLTLVKAHPKSAEAYSGLGEVYKAMRQYEKAITAHQTAIKHAAKMDSDWQRFFQRRLERVQQQAQAGE